MRSSSRCFLFCACVLSLVFLGVAGQEDATEAEETDWQCVVCRTEDAQSVCAKGGDESRAQHLTRCKRGQTTCAYRLTTAYNPQRYPEYTNGTGPYVTEFTVVSRFCMEAAFYPGNECKTVRSPMQRLTTCYCSFPSGCNAASAPRAFLLQWLTLVATCWSAISVA